MINYNGTTTFCYYANIESTNTRVQLISCQKQTRRSRIDTLLIIKLKNLGGRIGCEKYKRKGTFCQIFLNCPYISTLHSCST